MKRQHLRYTGRIMLADGVIHELSTHSKHELYRALRRRMRKLRAERQAPRFLEAVRV